MNIFDALSSSQTLAEISASPRLDTEVLLANVLNKDRSYLYAWPEKELSVDQQAQFENYLQQRQEGKPIAYIIGEKEFWSLNLFVNESTLIPRPETELIVETVLALYENDESLVVRHLIDLGTGTGAIALALASEKRAWQCVAVDKSMQACELAEKNRLAHQLNNVEIICSDWFQAVPQGAVDIIVSNPPYIDNNDSHLQQGDVRFEPHSALVAENQGLSDIEIIVQQAPEFLKEKGWLLIEHGYQQASAVANIFRNNGFSHIQSIKDLAGHERITIGQKSIRQE